MRFIPSRSSPCSFEGTRKLYSVLKYYRNCSFDFQCFVTALEEIGAKGIAKYRFDFNALERVYLQMEMLASRGNLGRQTS